MTEYTSFPEFDDPVTYSAEVKLEQAPSKPKTKEPAKSTEEINLPPMMCQTLSRQMGFYVTSHMANDLYFLNENIKIIIGYMRTVKGEAWLEDNIPDWKRKKRNLAYMTSKLQEVKTWYDTLENKKFDKEDADKNIRSFYFKSASKVALIDQDLYDLLGFCMLHTNLKRQIIPSDALKVIEQTGYKTLHTDKRKNADAQKQIATNE